MRLNRLFINHFKGIDKLEIKPEGKSIIIRGENNAGKTSVADAYSWAVFGKGFDGKQIDTQIKKRDKNGNTPNDGGIEHTVEVEFERDDGRTFTIRREFVEKWEKKRGTAESEFCGHTTNYSIDGVPMLKKEFDGQINMLCSEESFKLLSMPLHFCDLNWKDRRKILMEMCGGITDEDIISKTDTLAPLAKLLEGKTVFDLRKVIAAKIKKTNEEMKTIPARIDELTNAIPDNAGVNQEVLETEIASLEKQQREKQKQMLRIENGGEVAEKQKQIATIQANMTKLKAEFDAAYTAQTAADSSDAKTYKATMEIISKGIEQIETRKRILTASIESADKKAAALRDKWNAENDKEFSFAMSDVCPTCGQVLPPEKIEDAKQKALHEFNLKKSDTLENINKEGKKIMEQRKTDAAMLDDFNAEILDKTERLDYLSDQYKAVHERLGAIEKPNIDEHPEYIALKTQLSQFSAEIEELRSGNQLELQKVQREAALFDPEIAARRQKISAIEQAASIKKRINDLKLHEMELGDTYNGLQQQLFLTEEFMRAKVALTEDAINSHFEYVRFKMFNEKINGALEECCEPLINGVPYSDGLNKGGRMKAAIDIMNALSSYYKQTMPVFIDNCESYTSLIPVNSQLIKLIADGNYKTLNVEVEG